MFGTINEATGERMPIKSIETPWIALGCNRDSQLYAVAMDGTLLKVDKVNGNTEQIASLGFTANRRSTGAIDTATGIFYVVVTNEDSSTIDEYGYSISTSELYAAAMYPYSSTDKADDWLILPAINFEKGIRYSIEFQVSTASNSYPERLAVYYGTAPSPEALVNPIHEEKEYTIFDPVDEKASFVPAEYGMYHIGFHACSEPDGGGLALRNIKVAKSAGSAVDAIAPDNDSDAATEIYNLQGIRIDNPQPGQLIIKRRGTTATKNIVR